MELMLIVRPRGFELITTTLGFKAARALYYSFSIPRAWCSGSGEISTVDHVIGFDIEIFEYVLTAAGGMYVLLMRYQLTC